MKIKQVLFSTAFLALSISSFAQVGIGTLTPDASAMLDVKATTLGFLPPRMTEVQMNAIPTPAEGLIVYCTDCYPKGLYFNNGTSYLSANTNMPSNAIKDRKFGDGLHDFVYVAVYNSATGKTWLNNNLGAAYTNINSTDYNPTKQATASNDYKAFGSTYQWGRGSDNHELINWSSSTSGTPVTGTTTILSNTDTPGHGQFITTLPPVNDWRSPQNDNLWQGANGINNPCPIGYRVPTETELNAERTSWSSNNSAGALASPLKWVASGYRMPDGYIITNGQAFYGSQTNLSALSSILSFYDGNSQMLNNIRATGTTIRCIKD